MKKEKILGLILLISALLVISGFVIKNNIYWFVIDGITILVSGIIGILLLIWKK